jgi:phage baseplate assembly protein gpV
MSAIRLGKISSVNYKEGKARVTYEDRDQSVTSELPFLALQYHMPEVGDMVVVACLLDGSGYGVILGQVYGAANVPYEGAKGRFRQEMSSIKNEAVMSYDESTSTLSLTAPHIEFCQGEKVFNIPDTNELRKDFEAYKKSTDEQIESLKKRLEALGG